MPQFMYSFPSGALLGAAAGVWFIALAGVSLWRAQPKRRTKPVALAAVATVLATAESVSSGYILLTNFDRADGTSWHALPTMQTICAAAVGVAVFLVVVALMRRTAVLLTALLTGLTMAAANLCQFMWQLTDARPWALAVGMLWLTLPLVLLTFIIAVVLSAMRSNGRARALGYKHGLDEGYRKALIELQDQNGSEASLVDSDS